MQNDLQIQKDAILSSPKNPLIAHLNLSTEKDRNKYVGGLIEYVKKEVICKNIQKLEMLTHESVCSELAIAKKKWLHLGIYRPPTPENLASFF